MKFLLPVLLMSLFIAPLHAQDSDQETEPDKATQRENPASRVPYESGEGSTNVCEDRWSNFLPILGKAACDLGYVLPRPFGVSVGYMHQDQPFDVGGISSMASMSNRLGSQ